MSTASIFVKPTILAAVTPFFQVHLYQSYRRPKDLFLLLLITIMTAAFSGASGFLISTPTAVPDGVFGGLISIIKSHFYSGINEGFTLPRAFKKTAKAGIPATGIIVKAVSRIS
jgi:hypothetical protein